MLYLWTHTLSDGISRAIVTIGTPLRRCIFFFFFFCLVLSSVLPMYHRRHMMTLVQVDTVLSRLTALKERIEGTEALIEIDLDHRRNELVAFDLVR